MPITSNSRSPSPSDSVYPGTRSERRARPLLPPPLTVAWEKIYHYLRWHNLAAALSSSRFCRFCRAGTGRVRSGSLSRPSACIPCAAWMSRRKHPSSYRKREDSTSSRSLSGADLFPPLAVDHEAPPPTAFLSVAPGLTTGSVEASTDIFTPVRGLRAIRAGGNRFQRCRIRGVARLRHPPEPRRVTPHANDCLSRAVPCLYEGGTVAPWSSMPTIAAMVCPTRSAAASISRSPTWA